MKKLMNYLLATMVVASLLFSSCGDDEVDPLGPNITFKAGDSLTTGDVTVNQGDTVYFSWEVNKGDSKLDEFTIRLGALDVTGFPKTNIDKDQYEDTYATILLDAGVYDFTFIATDKDGLQDIKTINVTAEAAAGNIVSYNVTVSAQGASGGSSFASVNGVVYTKTDAIKNSDKIDFMAYYGSSNAATLASPDDADVNSVYDWIASDFSTINETKLGTTNLSDNDFDAISDDAAILAESANATDTDVNKLNIGDVIVFKTASTSAHANKYGLAKVTAVPADRNDSFELVVKVQE
jgi:hypothetical protein